MNDKYKKILEEKMAEFQEHIREDAGVKENMMNIYRGAYGDITEEEAEKIVDKLLEGIHKFDETLSAYMEKGTEAVLEEIDASLGEASNEEKYAAYLNAIVVIKTLDSSILEKILKEGNFENEEMFSQVKGSVQIESNAIVTDEMLEEARKQLADALETSVISLSDIKALQEMPQEEVEAFARNFADERWADEERKAYFSLAAYMAYQDEDIEMDEEASDPFFWAVSTAAAMETERVIQDAKKGLISWETARKILKGIGYTVLVLGMGLILLGVTGIFLDILGHTMGFLGTVFFAAIGIWIIGGMLSVSGKPLVWYSDMFDRAVEFISEHTGALRENIRTALKFVREKLSAGYVRMRDAVKNNILNRPTVKV